MNKKMTVALDLRKINVESYLKNPIVTFGFQVNKAIGKAVILKGKKAVEIELFEDLPEGDWTPAKGIDHQIINGLPTEVLVNISMIPGVTKGGSHA